MVVKYNSRSRIGINRISTNNQYQIHLFIHFFLSMPKWLQVDTNNVERQNNYKNDNYYDYNFPGFTPGRV